MVIRNTQDLNIGDELPTFIRKGTVEHWNRFAAVNDEFAPHHWDYDVARNEGFDAPFAMAPLQMSFFNALLRTWMGEQGRIISVSAKLKSPFFKEQTLVVTGRVTELQIVETETYIDIELLQADTDNKTVAIGTAQVALAN